MGFKIVDPATGNVCGVRWRKSTNLQFKLWDAMAMLMTWTWCIREAKVKRQHTHSMIQ
jgi:hypothetical protein